MTKPRILVVDDEESMRYFLRRSLKREGFTVETADTIFPGYTSEGLAELGLIGT